MDKVSVKPWGNSMGIRIPKKILEQMNIAPSEDLSIEVVDNSIVLKKIFKRKSFKERMNAFDSISAVDFDYGTAKGSEIL